MLSSSSDFFVLPGHGVSRDPQREREMGKQSDRQTARQTDRHRTRKQETERVTDRGRLAEQSQSELATCVELTNNSETHFTGYRFPQATVKSHPEAQVF